MRQALKVLAGFGLFLLFGVYNAIAQDNDAIKFTNRSDQSVLSATSHTMLDPFATGGNEHWWDIEYTDSGSFRIKSRKTALYLHILGGNLGLGHIRSNVQESMWNLESVDGVYALISNAAQPGIYLHVQNGALFASQGQGQSFAAMWKIETVPGSALSVDAASQGASQFTNRWKNSVFTASNGGVIETANSGAPEQFWDIEFVQTDTFRIRSRATGEYIYSSGGALLLGNAGQQDLESVWMLEPVDEGFARIKNVGQPDIYIHAQNAVLEATQAQGNWWSAMWMVSDMPKSGSQRGSDQLAGGGGGQNVLNNGRDWSKKPTGQQNGQQIGQQNGARQQASGGTRGKLPSRPRLKQGNRQQNASNQGQNAPRKKLGQSGSGQSKLGGRKLGQSNRAQSNPPAQNTARGQNAPTITLHIQNRSNAPILVFADDTQGKPVLLATLNPGQGMRENSPIGQIWRLAQNDQWLDAYRIEGEPDEQVITFPADAN